MSQPHTDISNDLGDAPNPAPQLPSGGSFGSDLNAAGSKRANWGVPTQLAVLGLLLVVSMAAIMAMRHFGTRTANADQIKPAKVDYTLDGLSAAAAAEQQRIVADLKRSVTPRANEYGRLPRNPFTLTEVEVEALDNPEDTSAEQSAKAQAEHEAAVKAEVASVQLQAVMGGSRPIARVNGNFLKVGERIGQHLTIAAIHGRSIEVTADGQTYVIEMAEADGKR